MASIAGYPTDDERASVYIEQMRQFRKGGKQPFYRPAVNREEQLIAGDVNRLVERITTGYQRAHGGAVVGNEGKCGVCGRLLPKRQRRLWRQVWSSDGRVDIYRCKLGCPKGG